MGYSAHEQRNGRGAALRADDRRGLFCSSHNIRKRKTDRNVARHRADDAGQTAPAGSRLRAFGLKVGVVGTVGLELRIRKLVEGMPNLACIIEPLPAGPQWLRISCLSLHWQLLLIVLDDHMCRRLMTIPSDGPLKQLATGYTSQADLIRRRWRKLRSPPRPT